MLRIGKHQLLSHQSAALILVVGAAAAVWLWVAWPSVDETPLTPTQPILAATSVEGYRLGIAEIGVDAPVNLDVPGTNEAEYLKALETGLAHYAGTARPGTVGNSFLFGHSSYLKEKPGDYKEVLKRLNEVGVDETVAIKHERETYTYKVFRSEVIADTDFSVLDPSDKEIITIMTCWPPGTIAKRWIVQAERIHEIPLEASETTPPTSQPL
ncbi:sortase [Candidatus Berkelbacteria bacterium]|nr:sortase [Candidatus Berkelbacteria bacterium]